MPSKKPHEGYWQERVYPKDKKKKIKEENEFKKSPEPVAFKDSNELKEFIIKLINEQAKELLNYVSVEVVRGDVVLIGSLRTLYEKYLLTNIIKSALPLQKKIRYQLKIKPLKTFSDTKIANEVVETIEKAKIKELIEYNIQVKNGIVYFKAQLQRDDLETKRKIFELISKIEGVRDIVISFPINSVNTPPEEEIEEEIKKIILDRGSIPLNNIRIFVIDGFVFLSGEIKSYNDMLYLEEKVGEIKGVKRVINQLTIGLWVTVF